MAKIYKVTDLIPLMVDDLTIVVSPLTFEQKMQVQAEILKLGSEGAMRGAKLACQYAVKEIKGLKGSDDADYQLVLKDGKITDECWDDLQNVKETQKIITICLNLINGIPKDFVNPQTGEKLKGVAFLKGDDVKKK